MPNVPVAFLLLLGHSLRELLAEQRAIAGLKPATQQPSRGVARQHRAVVLRLVR